MRKAHVVLFAFLCICITCTKNSNVIPEKIVHEYDSIKNYEINITYPFLKIGELDTIIKNDIDTNISNFKKFIADFDGYSTRRLDYSYKIHTNTDKLISIEQTFQWAVPGIERLLYYHKNLNYDLAKNKEIEVNDLFSPNYIDTLKTISTSALKRDGSCSLDSTETFTDFYFSNDTLYFNLKLQGVGCDDYVLAVEKSRLKSILK